MSEAARSLAKAGADIIQLRDKGSSDREFLKTALLIRNILKDSNVLFIINDRLGIAKISGADGVHLGQEDVSVRIARRVLGRNKIIGVSCHSVVQAAAAEREGADYIGAGPVFSTPTKPGASPIGPAAVGRISRKANVPVFAIGGIRKGTLERVLSVGVERVAVVREACRSKHIPKAIRTLKKRLGVYDRA